MNQARTDVAIDAAAALASSSGHKVFLLLLAAGASNKGDDVLRAIRGLIPDVHLAQSLMAGTVSGPFPRSAINELGAVRANRAVYWLLSEQFELVAKNKRA